MYSFYGGRPGNSFIIIKSFETVSDMVAAFKDGPNYTDVHYDEYVIINTIDKNSEDNGKIYRRGYDFQNAEGGAEYIGTIVGPAGGAPEVQMTTEAEVAHIYQQYKDNQEFDKRFSSNSYTLTNHGLVPGKQEDTFHDEISWRCCSLRDAETKTNTVAYIGFTIPYPVIDFTLRKVDPYTSLVANRIDDGTHPFYEKWQLEIPKGIKGDTFKNLQVITANNEDGVEPYTGQENDRTNGRKILVYEFYEYDQTANPTPKKIYVGDYNIIESINATQDGTIIINYSHDKEVFLNNLLKWITDVNYEQDGGQLSIAYNNGSPSDNFKIKQIQNVSFSDNGTLIFTYNTNELDEDGHPISDGHDGYRKQADMFTGIKWITSIELAEDEDAEVEEGESKPIKGLKISYNDNTDDTFDQFSWIDYVTINEENGTIDTVLSNGRVISSEGGVQIRWITGAELTSNGELKFTWNDGSATSVPNQPIKWIENVELTDSGDLILTWNDDNKEPVTLNKTTPIKWINDIEKTASGDLAITYNTGSQVFEKALYVPTDISFREEDRKIRIQWNGEEYRDLTDSLTIITDVAVDKMGNFLVKMLPTPSNSNITYNGTSGWSYIGTFGTEVFNFQDTSATIPIGHYFNGIIRGKNLYFTASSTKLLSKLITSIRATSGQFIAYQASTGNAVTDTIDFLQKTQNSEVSITSDLLGMNIIVNNVVEQAVQSPIPVFIEVVNPINLAFEMNQQSEEIVSLNLEARLAALEDDFQSTLNKMNLPQMKIYLLYHEGTYTEPWVGGRSGLPIFSTMGDCFIVSCGDTTVLVDASSKEHMDNTILPKIKRLICPDFSSNDSRIMAITDKIHRINHVIVSHYHRDHIEGFETLLNNENFSLLFDDNCKFYLPELPDNRFQDGDDTLAGLTTACRTLKDWISNAPRVSTETIIIQPWEAGRVEKTIIFDENNPLFSVRFLNANPNEFATYYTETAYNESPNTGTRYNNFSLVAEFKHGNVTFLSPGDIELPAQKHIAPYITKSPDIYKLEHHTFTVESDPDYLKRINPKIAFVLGRNDQNLDRYGRSKTIQHIINATNAIIMGQNYDYCIGYITSDGFNVYASGDGITNKGLMLATVGEKVQRVPNNSPTTPSLNNIRKPGTYYMTGGTKTDFKTIVNAPFAYYFKLIVCTITDSTNRVKATDQSNYENCVQIAISRLGEIAIRNYWNFTWSKWNYISIKGREPLTFSGNFVVNGIMGSKSQIYCTIPLTQPIDPDLYTVTINKARCKAYIYNHQIWGNDNEIGGDFKTTTGCSTKAWVTPFGISLQLNYKVGEGGFGGAIVGAPVTIEFKGSDTDNTNHGFSATLTRK